MKAFEFDASTLELRRHDEQIKLDSILRGVLLMLLSFGGQVVSKEEFLGHVWQGRIVEDANLAVAISKLRKALSPEGSDLIQTVHKVGYKFVADIERQVVKVPFQGLVLEAGQPAPGQSGWLLKRKIGSGGYGEVWLAQHRESASQRVFKFAADGKGLRALKREQAVFSIVSSSGADSTGFLPVLRSNFGSAPFSIEMPWGGSNLHDWCVSQGGVAKIPLDTRLLIVSSICGIVDQAHRLGIFHQDIKPSNILISGPASSPDVLLVDFGSSAVLDADRIMALSISRHVFEHSRSASPMTGMTIPYVAPEIGKGFAPTTRSDVFSVGVLLYQLVCADLSRPIAPGWERDVDDALLCDDIQSATQGDPDRRLHSAADLKQRLDTLDQRWQTFYIEKENSEKTAELEIQVAKANARRPWLIGAVAILILGILTSTSFYARAVSAQQQARHSLANVEAMNEFLSDDLIGAADPRFGGRADIELVEALKAAEPEIASRFQNDALVRGRLQLRLGEIYERLALYSEAVHVLGLASASLKQAVRPDAVALRLLADSNRSRSLFRTGEHKRAVVLAEETYIQAVRVLGLDNPVTTIAAISRARIPYEAGLNVESLEALDELKERIDVLPEEYSQYRIAAKQQVISILLNLQRMDEAGKRIMPFLAELRDSVGERHPDTLLARYYLGVHQHYSGDLNAAEETLTNVYADLVDVRGVNAWDALNTLSELSQIYLDSGEFGRAADGFGDLYRTRLELSGPQNVTVLVTQRNWAVALRKAGDVQRALAELRDNTQKFEALLGGENPQTVISAWEVALALAELGEHGEALVIYESIVERGEAMLANEPQWPPRKDYLLGRIHLAAGNKVTALPLLRRAREKFVGLFGDSTEFISEMDLAIEEAALKDKGAYKIGL